MRCKKTRKNSLVDPSGGVVLPVAESLAVGEPESDLGVGGLDGVRAVDDVTADIDAEVATDGAWCGVERLGGAEHFAASDNSVVAFPDHCANGAGCGVIAETSEEWLVGQIAVVLLEVGTAWLAELHADELEAFSLEASEDLTDESSLNAVRLDHDEGSFLGSSSLCHSVCLCSRI